MIHMVQALTVLGKIFWFDPLSCLYWLSVKVLRGLGPAFFLWCVLRISRFLRCRIHCWGCESNSAPQVCHSMPTSPHHPSLLLSFWLQTSPRTSKGALLCRGKDHTHRDILNLNCDSTFYDHFLFSVFSRTQPITELNQVGEKCWKETS